MKKDKNKKTKNTVLNLLCAVGLLLSIFCPNKVYAADEEGIPVSVISSVSKSMEWAVFYNPESGESYTAKNFTYERLVNGEDIEYRLTGYKLETSNATDPTDGWLVTYAIQYTASVYALPKSYPIWGVIGWQVTGVDGAIGASTNTYLTANSVNYTTVSQTNQSGWATYRKVVYAVDYSDWVNDYNGRTATVTLSDRTIYNAETVTDNQKISALRTMGQVLSLIDAKNQTIINELQTITGTQNPDIQNKLQELIYSLYNIELNTDYIKTYLVNQINQGRQEAEGMQEQKTQTQNTTTQAIQTENTLTTGANENIANVPLDDTAGAIRTDTRMINGFRFIRDVFDRTTNNTPIGVYIGGLLLLGLAAYLIGRRAG